MRSNQIQEQIMNFKVEVFNINYGKCGLGGINIKLEPLGKCSKCEKTAIINIPYAKQKLCKDCFNDFFVKRVKKVVEEFKMFREGEKVAVAVSGGKDSVALLHALKKAFPDQKIYAFYINLGIKYYSDNLEKKVIDLAQMLNVPLEIYNLKEKEGYTIDDFLITKYKDKMCSVCGTIKRNIFTALAKKIGADVVATGHNLDDTVSTMMSLFFAGDFEGIARLKPVLKPLVPGQPRKIKPLITTPEIEDLYYVALNELPVQDCSCPHGEFTSIKGIKKWLDEMEKEQPDIKFRLLSVFRKKLIPLIELNNKINQGAVEDKMKFADEIKECTICGMPSSSDICSKCKRVSELFEVKKRKNGNKKEELEITFDDLKNIMERENVILLDVRDKIEYLTKTLEGAINIPAQEIEKRWKELLKFKKTHKIIVFCNAGTTSYAVTIKLKNLGFDAYNLKGGILNIVNDGNNDANQNQSPNLTR
jgi:uncharacterized protein (TIGR00269 family)